MAGEADVADDVFCDDVALTRKAVTPALPAAADHDGTVVILLQRKETGGDTHLGAHDWCHALRDRQLVDENLDRQAHAEPRQHRLDPHASRDDETFGRDGTSLAQNAIASRARLD